MKPHLLAAAAGSALLAGTAVVAPAARAAPAPHPERCARTDGTLYAAVPGTQPVSCDVAGSTVSYTGIAPNGTKVFMDCAWNLVGGRPAFDRGYSKLMERNDGQNFFEDIRRVGDVWGFTKGMEMTVGSTVITGKTEIFTAAAARAARQCTVDTANDTWTDCRDAPAFKTAPATLVSMSLPTETYCRDYVRVLASGRAPSLTPESYSPRQASAWKKYQAGIVAQLTQ